MAALENRRHERVALSLASGKSAEQASRDADYPTDASSFVQNARKRAQRKDIKARVKELQTQISACVVQDAAWLLGKVTRLAGYEVELSKLKPSDVIAAQSLASKMIPGALVPQKIAETNPEGDGPPLAPEITDEDRIRALMTLLARQKTEAA